MNEENVKKKNIILIPCSGAEYNGELARRVAIRLSENSKISLISTMHCSTIFLKNVLLKQERMIEITKNNLRSSYIIIIDGCKISCASTIFRFLQIEPDIVIHIDELVPKAKINLNDIEAFKNRPRMSNIKEEDIEKVSKYLLKKLEEKKFEFEQN